MVRLSARYPPRAAVAPEGMLEAAGGWPLNMVNGGGEHLGHRASPTTAVAAFKNEDPEEESSAAAKLSLSTKVKILISFFQVSKPQSFVQIATLYFSLPLRPYHRMLSSSSL